MRRFGFRTILIGNGLLAAVAVAACALILPTTPLAITLAILFIGGVARSVQLTAINTIAFADVSAERMSGANTLFTMVQQISLGMGVAVSVLALRMVQALYGTSGQHLTSRDFHWAFLIAGLLAVMATIDAFALDARTGDHVSGRR